MVKLHWSLRYPFLYNCYTKPVRTSLVAATVIGGGYYIYNERQANTQANFTKWGFHIGDAHLCSSNGSKNRQASVWKPI